ncbi:hypothetical protein SAMN06265379_101107 [Saccharicrinis carchari]|uniref:Uncharacterized protein n=1 Tax=Saccharicrinis carchari TaxID=1168039 RepID=A0A521AFG1_SACCC|nr:hypothetical protein [Saccharicrinis carchari]SMO33554.1 hypothetical protein SAMN06265379_101107 [Saccharicrinis carchari]
MKSKENFGKKRGKRSTYNDFDDKLKPVKSNTGKSGKKISIYESLDDDFDESELDELFKYRDTESDEDDYDDEDDEDYAEDDEEE